MTGATGFLGSNLCFFLKEKGFDIVACGRNENKAKRLLSEEFEFVQADLSKDDLFEKFQNIDFVVHCAALSSPWGKYEDFYSSNVLATKNVAEFCLKNKIRLVNISSPSVYFEFKDKFSVKESNIPRKKVNFYAETKFLAEKTLENYTELKFITLRPRAIFGAGDTTLIPRLLKANNEKFIPITRNDDVTIDITHVKNVCEAIYLAITCDDRFLGNKYNVTNDEPVQLISFLKDLVESSGFEFRSKRLPFFGVYLYAYAVEIFYKYFLAGKEPPVTRYSVGVISFCQTLDIESIKKDLGYKPIVTMEQGKAEVLEWLKNGQ